MDLIKRMELFINDEVASGATTVADVAKNITKGNIDVIGGKCPDGQYYDKKKKVCVPIKESVTVGGGYVAGNSTVASSGQTRVVGRKRGIMPDLDRKEENPKLSLRFNRILGAYIPSNWLIGRQDTDLDEY